MTPWDQLVDSPVWQLPPHVAKLFVTLLALQDKDHVVRKSDLNIKLRAQLEHDEVVSAIDYLTVDDHVARVTDGYLRIIEGEKYASVIAKLIQRARNAKWMREKRAAKKPKISDPGPMAEILQSPICHANREGDCEWKDCPQIRDNEPATTGRHCPLGRPEEDL